MLVGDEGVSSNSQNLESRESVVSTITVWLTEDSVGDEDESLGLNCPKIAQPKMVFQALGVLSDPSRDSGNMICAQTSQPSNKSTLPGLSKVGSANCSVLI